MTCGIPKTEMNWDRALTTALVEIECSGYAVGYLVVWHMTVNKYEHPDFDGDKEPTQ